MRGKAEITTTYSRVSKCLKLRPPGASNSPNDMRKDDMNLLCVLKKDPLPCDTR